MADMPTKPIDKLFKPVLIACGVLLLLDLVIDRHPKVPGEALPFFYAIIAMATFVGVIFACRWLHDVLQRPTDFYGADAVDAEEYPQDGLDRVDAAPASASRRQDS